MLRESGTSKDLQNQNQHPQKTAKTVHEWSREKRENDLDMYTLGSELHISAENLPEFRALLAQAKKEAEQLNNTIAQLSHFEFLISFSADSQT